MSIPEEMIMRHLDLLLSNSEPGAALHHLHVVTAPADAIGPLGLPSEDQLKTAVYAIALQQEDDTTVDAFIAKVITVVEKEARENNVVVMFAATAQEVWLVKGMDDLGRRLAKQGRLEEHPNAVEVTIVYGACRDGRRWAGRRTLTGPQAGTTEDVSLLVGRPQRGEGLMPVAPLVRRLVGLW